MKTLKILDQTYYCYGFSVISSAIIDKNLETNEFTIVFQTIIYYRRPKYKLRTTIWGTISDQESFLKMIHLTRRGHARLEIAFMKRVSTLPGSFLETISSVPSKQLSNNKLN